MTETVAVTPSSEQARALQPLPGWGSCCWSRFLAFPLVLSAAHGCERSDRDSLWVKFLGRFHVVALHLPVGVLALAAIMELFVCLKLRSSQFLAPATTFTLMVGAAGSVVAVVLRHLPGPQGRIRVRRVLRSSGPRHRHRGGCPADLDSQAERGSSRVFRWPYRLVLALTLLVMAAGAHFGGNMVHESDYLTKYAPAPVRDRHGAVRAFCARLFRARKSAGRRCAA